MTLRVSPARTAALLAAAVALLAAAHGITALLAYRYGYEGQLGLRRLLNLNGEANLPAWFSSSLLLVAALVLAVIWRTTPAVSGSGRRYWAGLSMVFLFLAVDEAVELHELLNAPLRTGLGAGGLLYWAWVIPYGIAALMVALVCARFLRRLPRRTAALFIAAGILYVGGALALEMLGGHASAEFGPGTLPVVIAYTLEEICEMLGMVLFVYALLDYLARRDGAVEFDLRPRGGGDRAAGADVS